MQRHFQAFGLRALDAFDEDWMRRKGTSRESVNRIRKYMLASFWQILHGQYDYEHERKEPARRHPKYKGILPYLDRTPLANETLPILRARMKSARGLRNKSAAFSAHFGYAILLMMNNDTGARFKGSMLPADKLRKIQEKAFLKMKRDLEQEPLRLYRPSR